MCAFVFVSDDNKRELSAGINFWPFVFRIPENIPSSLEAKKGYIRYSIKVKVDIPMGFDDKKKIYFSVNTPVDLNKSPDALVSSISWQYIVMILLQE